MHRTAVPCRTVVEHARDGDGAVILLKQDHRFERTWCELPWARQAEHRGLLPYEQGLSPLSLANLPELHQLSNRSLNWMLLCCCEFIVTGMLLCAHGAVRPGYPHAHCARHAKQSELP